MCGLSSSLTPHEPSLVSDVCALFNDTYSLQVFIPIPELSSKKALPPFFSGRFLWLLNLGSTEPPISLTSGHTSPGSWVQGSHRLYQPEPVLLSPGHWTLPPRPCSLRLSHLHLPAIPWLSQSSPTGNFVFIFLSLVLLHHRCGWPFLIFSGPSSNVSSWSNPYISLLTYWTKVTRYGREELNLASWRVHSDPEAVTVLWRATGPFIPLSEIEYNGNFQDQYSHPCQDTMVPARCTGYTRLMSKTKCHVKFPGFLDFRGTYREARSSLNVSQPQGVHGFLKN